MSKQEDALKPNYVLVTETDFEWRTTAHLRARNAALLAALRQTDCDWETLATHLGSQGSIELIEVIERFRRPLRAAIAQAEEETE